MSRQRAPSCQPHGRVPAFHGAVWRQVWPENRPPSDDTIVPEGHGSAWSGMDAAKAATGRCGRWACRFGWPTDTWISGGWDGCDPANGLLEHQVGAAASTGRRQSFPHRALPAPYSRNGRESAVALGDVPATREVRIQVLLAKSVARLTSRRLKVVLFLFRLACGCRPPGRELPVRADKAIRSFPEVAEDGEDPAVAAGL